MRIVITNHIKMEQLRKANADSSDTANQAKKEVSSEFSDGRDEVKRVQKKHAHIVIRNGMMLSCPY